MRLTFRSAMTVSAEVENQAAVDRVQGDFRAILGRLEWIWRVIDDARVVEKAGGARPFDDDLLELPFDADDIAFIRERLNEGLAVERDILNEQLDPTARREIEESIELGLRASEELSRWAESRG